MTPIVPSSVLHPPSSVIRWSSSAWRLGLPLALFAILWVDLVRQLSYTWETNEQYAYGWFVPILALALFIRRWMDRPEGTKAESRKQKAEIGGGGAEKQKAETGKAEIGKTEVNFYSLLSIFLLLLLLLPLRVIFEINQDWPLIAWPYTIIVVALTLYALHLADPFRPSPLRLERGEGQGEVSSSSAQLQPSNSSRPSTPRPHPSGSKFQLSTFPISAFASASPWVKHFAFPICFILVAVQWPYRIEQSLTQNLMQVVASLTVEILGWLNIPALQRGNLIELSTGTVGVDEACSGIRSFQSTLMAALFLGELYRLRMWARTGLVAGGLVLAFGFNVIRTLILTWQANAHGISAIDKWHDPAGFTITIACFFVLWAIALLIKRKWSPSVLRPPSSDPRPQPSPREMAAPPISLGPSSILRPPSSVLWRRYAAAVGLWSLLCTGATELWYRSHEATDTDFVRWSVTFPTAKPTFETIKLPPRTLKLLAFDSGTAAQWHEEDGSEWTVDFFQWQGKSIQSIMAARYHRPEVCLPASGLKQISDSQIDYFQVAGLKLPFRKSSYSAPGQTLYVFYCIWQDGDEHRKGMRSRDRGDRLLGPIEGRRRFGQQVLEIITSGYDNAAEAEQAVRQRLPDLIRVERPAGPAKSPGSH